jgi:hypothetical protein
MLSELTVIIKDDEKSLRKKFIIYDEITTSEVDPIIKDCIDQTLANFNGDPDHIEIKISMDFT